jgi:hypothetical protein
LFAHYDPAVETLIAPAYELTYELFTSGPQNGVIPKILRFDPATGMFSDTGIDLHFSSQFRSNVGDLIAVIPLGCIAPNAAGTGDSYIFPCVVSNNTIPGSVVFAEFDANSGALVDAFFFSNEDDTIFMGVPGFWKFTGVESGARTFLASILPITVQLKFAKPFMATAHIPNPPSALKIYGQPFTFGTTTIHAIEISTDSVCALSEKGDLVALLSTPEGWIGASELFTCEDTAVTYISRLNKELTKHLLVKRKRAIEPGGDKKYRLSFHPHNISKETSP